jgi:hypothetical protein
MTAPCTGISLVIGIISDLEFCYSSSAILMESLVVFVSLVSLDMTAFVKLCLATQCNVMHW